MKIILAVMCGLVVLFMGGCVVLTMPMFPFPLIPGAIAFLNLAILGVLYGWKLQWRPAFYILGAIDILLAIFCVVTASQLGPSDSPLVWLAALVIGLKGVFSFLYARQLRTEA